MLLTEYNEVKAMELFKEEGREEGREEAFELLSTLINRLLDLGRSGDIPKVTRDPAYRDKLISEFGLA